MPVESKRLHSESDSGDNLGRGAEMASKDPEGMIEEAEVGGEGEKRAGGVSPDKMTPIIVNPSRLSPVAVNSPSPNQLPSNEIN